MSAGRLLGKAGVWKCITLTLNSARSENTPVSFCAQE